VRNADGSVTPGVPFGPKLVGLPPEVEAAYEEARRCMAATAYTAAELVCRNILMHVAVEKKAKPGLTFAAYVDHLVKAGFVTPPMQAWVDLIRQHGGKAAHELDPPDKSRAESTVQFTAQLLRSTYEMAELAKPYTTPPATVGTPAL
jgi:hypothetical protein